MPTLHALIICPRRAAAELGESSPLESSYWPYFGQMSNPVPLIALENVDVDIDGHPVLRGIELTIAAGQHWGIVGANGSGKSTLLALIAGRRWPAPGRGIRVYDFGSGPERDAVTARRRIALFGHELQDLYAARAWNFRARDIVLSGLTRTDIPQRRVSRASKKKAEALLEQMDLSHLADRRLLTLSRGEQRRVLITRSLAFEPALLLLDEPASGLDAESRAELEATLERAKNKTQIVIAAHRIDELPSLVTNIAALDAGRLLSATEVPGRATISEDKQSAVDLESRREAQSLASMPDSTEADRSEPELMIELKSASAWLGDREVLKRIDWQLMEGENWLVTGENGAGKSTLLRMLHGEIRPARGGSIRWPGVGNPRNVWALRRQVALVSAEFQARYRFPTTVFDAVASGFHSSIGLVRGLSADQRDRVAELLVDFELEAFRDRLLSSLSYGQRHRTLIARTLATRPKILLLDEPWEGLDAETSGIVGYQIEKAMSDGVQVVCVSHIGPQGLTLNRTLMLADGRIVSVDDKGAPTGSSSSARRPAAGSRQR